LKDWGGILQPKIPYSRFNNEFLHLTDLTLSESQVSKVGAYMFPEKYIIYDSGVYALNWIILSGSLVIFSFNTK
jgi:hypothetical protein